MGTALENILRRGPHGKLQETQSWAVTTVDSAGNVGQYNSIDLNSSDNMYISYHDVTNTAVKYATNSTGSWVPDTVINGTIRDNWEMAPGLTEILMMWCREDPLGSLRFRQDKNFQYHYRKIKAYCSKDGMGTGSWGTGQSLTVMSRRESTVQ